VTVPEAGLDCSAACDGVVADGTTITVTAVPAVGWQFAAWGGDCAFANPAASFSQSLLSNLQCSASFVPLQTLSVTLAGEAGGGSVQSDPAGIDCAPDCSFGFPDGSSVTLTAVSAAPEFYEFIGWQGDCSGSAPEVNLSMSQARSCSAQFEVMPYAYAAVLGDGRVAVPEAGLDCGEVEVVAECFKRIPTGTAVIFTAIPSPGARFVRWYDACSGTHPVQPQLIDGDKRCLAEFVGGRRIYASGFESP
jgi:hypothetical protein